MSAGFANPGPQELAALLRGLRTVAVVGLSADPLRPSYRVARALQQRGLRIVPVNPALQSVLGETAVGTLAAAQAALPAGTPLDLIDVFRASEYVPALVEEAIAIRAPALWLQEGVVHEAAARRARAAGMRVVMDLCIARVWDELDAQGSGAS
jgi:predicted CoA-binding protein